MPTYEYECRKCGKRFERFQSMTDAPVKRCPRRGCRGTVKRLIGTGAGIIFKGSGFYETDYRSESYRKAEKAEKTTSSESSAGKKEGAADKKTSEPAKKTSTD